MKYFNNKAEKLWKNKVIAECEKIKVIPGKCRFNFRCHNNTIHDAVKNNDDKAAVVFYLSSEGTILHYVNFHKGKFIDNTLGFWCSTYDYYFYKWINKEQFNNEALDVFDSIRSEWKKLIPFYWRWLVNTDI